MEKTKLKPYVIVELAFDVLYLVFAISAGIAMLALGENVAARVFGLLALTLGVGDCFHLVPRIYCLATDTMDEQTALLGVGKLVTSITMTAFYVMLHFFWQIYYQGSLVGTDTTFILILALVRVALCVSPKNGWDSKKPPLKFAILRNIPFLILGIAVCLQFAQTAVISPDAFSMMPIAIALSFLFYLIVVLFAGKNKKMGAFMLPKTCAYIWIICMGLSLI